jgi:hypothetical protein
VNVKVLPLKVIPESSGAALRSAALIDVTAPLPSIKLSSGVELPPPHPVSEMTETIANVIKEIGLRI